MKSLCILLSIAACFILGSNDIRAAGQSPTTSPLFLDKDKPAVSVAMDCAGVYRGTATDKPDVALGRANLGIMILDAASFNYELTHDPISVGQTVSAGFHLYPIDYSKAAQATVHIKDAIGNDSIIVVSYTPKQLVMTSIRVDSLYPTHESVMRIPLINQSGDTIRVNSVTLDSLDAEFRLDASTPSNVLLRNNDTLWVTVRVQSAKSGSFSNNLRAHMGCESRNVQSLKLDAVYGSLDIVVQDVDFGKKKVNTQWIADVKAVNNGSLAATLTSLSLKNGAQSFALRNLISLPIVIAPGATVKLADVEFAPKLKGTWLDNFSYDVQEDAVGAITTPVVKAESDEDVEVRETADEVIRISPSPASDILQVLYLKGANSLLQATLYDVNGNALCAQKSTDGAPMQFDLTQYECGLYLCRVDCGSEQWTSRVFIVR